MTVDEEHEDEDSLESFQFSLLLISMGLFIGAATRFLQKKSGQRVPYTVAVMFIGMLLGAMPEKALGHLGRAVSQVSRIDPHLLLGAFIPALVFESAFATNFHIVRREFSQSLLLSGPGVLLNTFLTAALMYWLFPYHWDWAQATLFGSIVSATDPVAVVALLAELGASKRLATLIEGESLLNDGTAFVLYTIALEFVKGQNPNAAKVFLMFLRLAIGGVAVGIAFGCITALWLTAVFNDAKIEISITLFTCYLTFHVAEAEVGASGVLAVVFLGLCLSKYKDVVSPGIDKSLHHVWDIMSHSANTLIFLFSGIIIVRGVNRGKHVGFADIGLLIVLYLFLHIIRALSLVLLWPFLRHSGYGLDLKEAIVIVFGGLRGVIGLALALITRMEYLLGDTAEMSEGRVDSRKADIAKFKDLVMFHVCGIVFLTLVLNATAMKYLVRYLKLDRAKPQAVAVLKQAMDHLRAETRTEQRAMSTVHLYSGADWEQVMCCLPNYTQVLGALNEDSAIVSRKTGFSFDEGHYQHSAADSRMDICLNACHSFVCGCCNGKEDIETRPAKVAGRSQGRGSDQPLRARRDRDDDGDAARDVALNVSEDSTTIPRAAVAARFASLADGRSEDYKEEATASRSRVFGMHPFSRMNLMRFPRKSKADSKKSAAMEQRPTFMGAMDLLLEDTSVCVLDAERDAGRSHISHRVLSVLKSSYRGAYECGRISQQGSRILTEAVEAALDFDDLKIHFEKVQKVFSIPWWLRSWYESNLLKRLSRHLLFARLRLAVEVGTALITSSKSVNSKLSAIGSLSGSQMCRQIVVCLDNFAEEIREEWLSIQQSYPEVYRAIQTQHAAQHILQHEAAKIEELAHEGLLEEAEFSRMKHLLKEAQHSLSKKSFVNVTLTEKDQKNLLENLEFMKYVTDKETYKLVMFSDKKIKTRNEKLYSAGHPPIGAIVIARGTAMLRSEGVYKKESYVPGSFLVWEYLANREYLCDLVAQTTVEYFVLEDRTMRRLLRLLQVEEVIYQMAATNLLCAHFMDQFCQYTRLEISKMCHWSTFHKTLDNELRTLMATTLLLKGDTVFEGGDNPAYNAPYLFTTETNGADKQFRFDRDSVLLQFFIDPLADKRRGVLQQRSVRRLTPRNAQQRTAVAPLSARLGHSGTVDQMIFMPATATHLGLVRGKTVDVDIRSRRIATRTTESEELRRLYNGRDLSSASEEKNSGSRTHSVDFAPERNRRNSSIRDASASLSGDGSLEDANSRKNIQRKMKNSFALRIDTGRSQPLKVNLTAMKSRVDLLENAERNEFFEIESHK